MPDYGHPLRFGSFITPVNRPVDRAVDLAVHSEQVGLDLVTFQDQPNFHDTWTLLTWVAARTERIHLAGNVLNLPLRQPAVLARAAASLDLLSGGRVALGLGAGGFWDAIEAMGGDRLTPGESVDALEQAIEVIHGIWDTTQRSTLRAGGDHHRVVGAKRGPAPAHPIPIWLGAYKPRMLRLIARQADGWLPSLPYLKPGDLERGNRTIDEAATAAGRDPREVTRLVNITPDTTTDQMVALAVDHGISTFIAMGDSEPELDTFAGRASEVRDRVAQARARAGTTDGGQVRSAKAMAKRAAGIGYDTLPASLAERAVEPGDHGYARYTAGYLRGGAPGLVLRPSSVAEVVEAVAVAREHRELPLGIFSAGHGLSGRSLNTGGLVIDVGALNDIEVLDPATGRVRVGPGARWVEVARALDPHGRAITSGDYGGVGVGGLATAGGVGWFARRHGLTIDLLRRVQVVLADGTVHTADRDHNADLFWAVRGAGANFGVVTSFEFEAPKVGNVAFAQLVFDAADTAAFLQRWGRAIEGADRRVTGQVMMGAGNQHGRQARAMLLVDAEDPDTIVSLLQRVADIAPLLDQQVALTRYRSVMEAFSSDDEQQGFGEPLSHSGLLAHLEEDVATGLAAMLDANAAYVLQIRAVGGAVADTAPQDSAYAPRTANFAVNAFGTRSSGLDAHWDRLLPHFDGMYLSFESAVGPDVVARAFPPAHLARLRELKRRYDPTGLFRDNFFIDPEAADGSAA